MGVSEGGVGYFDSFSQEKPRFDGVED